MKISKTPRSEWNNFMVLIFFRPLVLSSWESRVNKSFFYRWRGRRYRDCMTHPGSDGGLILTPSLSPSPSPVLPLNPGFGMTAVDSLNGTMSAGRHGHPIQ